jgi:hypothetical protein
MKKPFIPLLLLAALLAGCKTSSPQKQKQLEADIGSVYGATFSPIMDMFMLKHGSLDLLYDTASFRSRNSRWPADYAELTNFVNSSGGYLWLGRYETVQFTSVTNDCLEISYSRPGQKKETKITIGDALLAK